MVDALDGHKFLNSAYLSRFIVENQRQFLSKRSMSNTLDHYDTSCYAMLCYAMLTSSIIHVIPHIPHQNMSFFSICRIFIRIKLKNNLKLSILFIAKFLPQNRQIDK